MENKTEEQITKEKYAETARKLILAKRLELSLKKDKNKKVLNQ